MKKSEIFGENLNLNWCIVNFFPWLSWNGGTFWCLKSSQNWSNWCKSLAMEVDLLCSSVPFRVKWRLEWLIQWPLKLVENIKESRLCKYAYFNHHSSNWKITKKFHFWRDFLKGFLKGFLEGNFERIFWKDFWRDF